MNLFERRWEEAVWFWSNYWWIPLILIAIIILVAWLGRDQ